MPILSLPRVHDQPHALTQGQLPLCPECSLGPRPGTSASLKVTSDGKVSVHWTAATYDVVF